MMVRSAPQHTNNCNDATTTKNVVLSVCKGQTHIITHHARGAAGTPRVVSSPRLRTTRLARECGGLFASQILYAIAGQVGSTAGTAMVLASRGLAGIFSGPQMLTTYITRAVPVKKRSAAMLKVGVTVSECWLCNSSVPSSPNE